MTWLIQIFVRPSPVVALRLAPRTLGWLHVAATQCPAPAWLVASTFQVTLSMGRAIANDATARNAGSSSYTMISKK